MKGALAAVSSVAPSDQGWFEYNLDCLGIASWKKGRQEGQLSGRSPYLQAVHAVADEALIGQIVPVQMDQTRTNSLTGTVIAS